MIVALPSPAAYAAGDGNATIPVAVRTTDQVDSSDWSDCDRRRWQNNAHVEPARRGQRADVLIHRGNATGAEVNLTNWLGTSWVDSNVTGGQTYYYTVSALDRKGGESQMSAEASAMPAAAHALAAQGALLDQLWFRIILIMTILVVGFFSFIIFVRKGKVQVKRDKWSSAVIWPTARSSPVSNGYPSLYYGTGENFHHYQELSNDCISYRRF